MAKILLHLAPVELVAAVQEGFYIFRKRQWLSAAVGSSFESYANGWRLSQSIMA